MREIKFRAKRFDGTWVYSDCENGAGGLAEFFDYMVGGLLMTDPEQYTGLKDKNGREIYEGDIVNDGHKNHVMKFWDNLGYDDNVMASGFYFDSQLDYYDNPKKWEVIGNINENQELLK